MKTHDFYKKAKRYTYQKLRASEKYTKTDMIYLTKGGFWVWGGQFVVLFAGLALAVAFANLVPPKIYGEYKFILAAAGLIGAFSLTGLRSAMVRSVAQGSGNILKQGFIISLKWSIPMFLIALAASGYYYYNHNIILSLGMLAIAIFQPLRQSASLFENFLNGKKNFKKRGIYMAIREIVAVIALIICMVVFPAHTLLFIFVFLGLQAFLGLGLFLRTLARYRNEAKKETADTDITSYAKHLSVMNGIVIIGRNIDKILVFHFLGAVQLAWYSFALLPANTVRDILQSIQFLALPRFANHDMRTLRQALLRKALLFFVISAITTIILILAIPFIFNIVIPEYTEAIPFARLFSLVLLFLPAVLYSQALTAHEKTKELYTVRFTSNIVKIILLIVLLPLYGLWGAIFAYLGFFIAQLVTSATCFYFIKEEVLFE